MCPGERRDIPNSYQPLLYGSVLLEQKEKSAIDYKAVCNVNKCYINNVLRKPLSQAFKKGASKISQRGVL